jgi:hypothetical protein
MATIHFTAVLMAGPLSSATMAVAWRKAWYDWNHCLKHCCRRRSGLIEITFDPANANWWC